jgi:diguanylate cyclase (GGDEF)-like protein
MAVPAVDDHCPHIQDSRTELTRDDPGRLAVAGAGVPRQLSYALIGACLAQGAAAGLLLLRMGDRRQVSLAEIGREVATDLGTYAYVAVSTTVAFSLFGGLVGHYADQLAQLASTDTLTGLLNTRAFRSRFHEEMVRALRYRQPLSILIADLDGLKRVNDEYGHEAGDDALRRVATAIRTGLREADVGARVGGDEFVVVGPNTDESAAIVFAERLRALVAQGNANAIQRGTTVSIGIASFVPSDGDGSCEFALMRAADAALYRAKRDGGNSVRVLTRQSGECHPEIVRPQDDREHTLPKRQVQKPDGEEPCREPECSRETVLLDFDPLHLTNSLLTRR